MVEEGNSKPNSKPSTRALTPRQPVWFLNMSTARRAEIIGAMIMNAEKSYIPFALGISKCLEEKKALSSVQLAALWKWRGHKTFKYENRKKGIK